VTLAALGASTAPCGAELWRGAEGKPEAAAPVVILGGQGKPDSVAFAAPAHARPRSLQVAFRLRMTGPAEGAGLVLLGTAAFGRAGPAPTLTWQEPNLRGCLAVGFDARDPKSDNWFDADGNVCDRPQHEVSLHWDGEELANVLSPVAFEDGKPHEVAVGVTFVVAGALVSVALDGRDVYRDAFLIGPRPYEWRPAFGFNPGADMSSCDFALLAAACAGHPDPPIQRTRVRVFRGAVLNSGHQEETVEADLPPAGRPVKRIILTYTLAAPPGGIDPWDRVISFLAPDEQGRRLQILRGITPFGKPYTWHADVTDYQSILRGRRKMAVVIGTWVKGWLVDMTLDYYWGKPDLEPFRVTQLWAGDWEYGNPADPLDGHFETRRPVLDPATRAARLRIVVTGHGMSPNTDNAAEFYPAKRTVTVNGAAFESLLWREDNYLNPCRPQGGTWKFDRAGWGPGALVRPWDLDITRLVRPGRPATMDYKPAPYVNENAGKGRASHLVEVQLIEYR
jgi:hypothetical protein